MLYGHGGNISSFIQRRRLDIDPDQVIDFSVSVSFLGYPPGLEDELRKSIGRITRYPEVDSLSLRKALAEHHGVTEENIIVGNGSTELLYLMPRALEIKRALSLAPSYLDYRDALQYSGSVIDYFYLDRENGFVLDPGKLAEKLKKQEAVFLCHPNNPTGRLLPIKEIKGLIKEFSSVLFVIDEAYLSMTPGSRNYSFIEKNLPENLIVLRSLTKSFAIPGIRLGYAVAARRVIDRLYKRKEPWTVNAFAVSAGKYLIRQQEWLEKSAEKIAVEKEILVKGLNSIEELKVFQTDANFILLKILREKPTSGDLQLELLKKNCFIRDCSNYPGLDGSYFRIAVKNGEQNRTLVTALNILFCQTP